VQLIDARNGYHLWSERFDREIEDIFAIQDEIARSVLGALGLSLTRPEERQFLKSSTTNVEAYDFYLRGRKLFQKWTRQSGESARRMFERAIELDPEFAAAWAGLATIHVHLFRWGLAPDLENAHKASARALKLDPDLAEAHVAAGQAFAQERRYAGAATEYEQAIALDPTLFDAYYYYGRSSFESAELEKSAQLFEKAQQVRPDDYQSYHFMAHALTELGRPDEAHRADRRALECIEKYLELNPDEARAYSLGAGLLASLGQTERARQWNEQAISLAPDDTIIVYNAGCNLTLLGEEERALDTLERAINGGLLVGDWMQRDPDFARLRGHPRFQALVKRMAGKDSTSK
jgi:adenylate cyclase